MSSTSEPITQSLAAEARQKRQRIGGSLWPRARLLVEILYQQIDRDRVFTQASALTYKTLFSLLPIFVLSLLVLHSISAGDGRNALDVGVRDMLFKQLAIDKLPITNDAGQPVLDGEGKPVTLTHVVDQLIAGVTKSITNTATGIVAFGILLYGAISLMIVIEGTFNLMYGAVKPRSWPRRIMLYWCVLTLGPIGVGASIAFGRTAFSTATEYAGAHWILSTLNVVTGFFVSWVLILLMYKLIPDTRVHWRPAAIGSFLATLAWEIGKWGFGLYVQRAVRTSWYGSLALLPLFMFWIYISWSVVLIGLEATYIQQYWGLLKRRFFFLRGGARGMPRTVMISDMRWVLALGVLICKRFRAGKTTEIDAAAEVLVLPNDVAGELMVALEKAGLVHNVGDDAYALARPAEQITAFELLAAARAMFEVPAEWAKSRAVAVAAQTETACLREIEELETTWARKHTLADLAG